MHCKQRKRAVEVLAFLKNLRRRYNDGRKIYLVLDNASAHHKSDVVLWCSQNNIELVFIATNASWMNRIECHFAPFKQFVINNSDYPNHKAIQEKAQQYLRWRNKNAKDKRLLKAQNTVRVM